MLIIKPITMNGKYQTRDGRPVRILCVDGPTAESPVVAIVGEGPTAFVGTWPIEGVWNADEVGKVDLIPIHVKHVAWAWISASGRVLGFCGQGREYMEENCEPNERVRLITWVD